MCSEENNVYPLTICADLRGGVHLGVAVKRKSPSLCALHTQAGGPPRHVNRSCLIELNGIRNAAALHPSPIYLSPLSPPPKKQTAETHTHTHNARAHLHIHLHTHTHTELQACTSTLFCAHLLYTQAHPDTHTHTQSQTHTHTHTHTLPSRPVILR